MMDLLKLPSLRPAAALCGLVEIFVSCNPLISKTYDHGFWVTTKQKEYKNQLMDNTGPRTPFSPTDFPIGFRWFNLVIYAARNTDFLGFLQHGDAEDGEWNTISDLALVQTTFQPGIGPAGRWTQGDIAKRPTSKRKDQWNSTKLGIKLDARWQQLTLFSPAAPLMVS